MENENLKKEYEKTAWSVMTGGQKFCIIAIFAVLILAFAFLFIKITGLKISKIAPVQKQIVVAQSADKLTDKEAYRTNLENQTAKKVQSVLEKIVGKDNVSVQVNAEIDFNSTKATIEKYTPAVGTASAKEIKQVVSAPGAIKRITVAVAVNKILTSKEKQELTELIASASGVDFARGDAVSISSLRFLGLAEQKAEQLSLAKSAKIASIIKVLVKDIAPLLVILGLGLALIAVIKQLLKKTPVTTKVEYVQQNVPTMIDYEAYEPKQEGLGGIADNIANEFEPEKPTEQYTLETEQIKSELNKTILNDTAEAARLLTSYIKD